MRILLVLLVITSHVAQAQRSDFAHIDFQKADSVAMHYKGEAVGNLPVLAHKLSKDLHTDVEKFRAIYTWVCTNIENDYYAYLKNKKQRKKLADKPDALAEWSKGFQVKVFDKLRKEQKTVCTGYAYVIRELARFADIQAVIVNGYGRTPTIREEEYKTLNHSWNAVKLGKKWYLCDATWSSGSFHPDQNSFVANYQDGYFLADPTLFITNHYPEDTRWVLLKTFPSLQEYFQGPVVYKYAFKHQIIPVGASANTMKWELTQGTEMSFTFQVPEAFKEEELEMLLSSGNHHVQAKPSIERDEKGQLVLQYTFERKGFYDVHFKIGDEYIITYTMKVSKR